MLEAEQAGYKTTLNKQLITDFLLYNLENYQGYNKLLMLLLLHVLNAKIDYNHYLDSIQKQQRIAAVHGNQSMYDQLRWLEMKQRTGAKISLDTLVPNARKTMLGNLYWGEENRHFFDNSIQITLIMYRLMKGVGGYEAELKKVRNYFLEVNIFCSTLKKGEYTFTVSLMPRYNGIYHLNPAKAELMYFPTFFGREEMKKIAVN